MMRIVSLLVAPYDVIVTTSVATNDNEVGSHDES